jgi:DNA-binding response OmpR family regulator
VEDEPLVLVTIEHYLRRAGHRPLGAETVDEALGLAREHAGAIDLLLTDVRLPGLGGRELARLVGEHCPGVAVLFMSAFTRHRLLTEERIDPGCVTIEKPFSEDDLLERVAELLER